MGGDELTYRPVVFDVHQSIVVLAAGGHDVNPPVDGAGGAYDLLDLMGQLARGAVYTFPSESIKPRKPLTFTTLATAWSSSP